MTSHIQIFSGRAADAVKTIETNMRLDPVYPEITLHFLAEARFSLGDFNEAIAALKRRLERNPDLRVVIDHAAKPNIASGERLDWSQQLAPGESYTVSLTFTPTTAAEASRPTGPGDQPVAAIAASICSGN